MELIDTEWLEPDGLGGYALGTAALVRTRRYHALLMAALDPPARRTALLGAVEATADGINLADRIESFTAAPFPRWTFQLGGGARLELLLFIAPGTPRVHLRYSQSAGPPVRLRLRPLLAARDDHHTERESPDFDLRPTIAPGRVTLQPRPFAPPLHLQSNGTFTPAPEWRRNCPLPVDQARGYPETEDLAVPGAFEFDLGAGPAYLLAGLTPVEEPARKAFERAHLAEQSRRANQPPLDRAADSYLVRRGAGNTIIAGYPWFLDWGRDTFIALRGLCLARGRLDEARRILVEWSAHVSEGMLPNRFPDRGGRPEYNSADASLWYVIAACEYLEMADSTGRPPPPDERAALESAIRAILDGYTRGTRHGIRLDKDCLLRAGEPGFALTWMDAKCGDRVFTPRIGKPVELQALWLNALFLARRLRPPSDDRFAIGFAYFRAKFWNPQTACLYDVIDCDHVPGKVDPSIRPNQIFAAGGLPLTILTRRRSRRVVDLLESRLLTPFGLRTLDPADPQYRPHYEGDLWSRDGAYHQGTVWPWLLGPFAEAWVRAHGDTPAIRNEARARFLAPLLESSSPPGTGQLPEIADGDPPHSPRGCPFQAWSVAEALRLDRAVLAPDRPRYDS